MKGVLLYTLIKISENLEYDNSFTRISAYFLKNNSYRGGVINEPVSSDDNGIFPGSFLVVADHDL